MDKGAILNLGGGGMKAVFEAGFVHGLTQDGIGPEHLHGCVSGSAGIVSGNNLLLRNTAAGLRTFRGFILSGAVNARNAVPFLLHRALSSSPPRKHIMNVDGVMNVVEEHGGLNIDGLRRQHCESFVRLLNRSTGEVELADLRVEDELAKARMRAAVTFAPFCIDPSNKSSKMDACVVGHLGLPEILKKYPDRKIFCVTNVPVSADTSWRRKFQQAVYGLLCFDKQLGDLYRSFVKDTIRDLRIAEKNPNICIIEPPSNFPVRLLTSDLGTVSAGFMEGMKEKYRKRFMQFLEKA